MKSYDPTLLQIFAAEQAEHVERIRAAAEALAASAEPPAHVLDELLRRAHTLKGAARAVGIEGTERLAHAIETVFGRLHAGRARPGEPELRAVRTALEAAEDVLAAALAGRPEPSVSEALAALEIGGAVPPPAPVAPPPVEPDAAAAAEASELVRVSAGRIDDVARSAAELLAIAASAAADARRAGESQELARQLEDAWRRFRRVSSGYARQRRDDVEFAPVLESMDKVDQLVRAVSADATAAVSSRMRHAWELGERASELHGDVRLVRMVTADAVFGSFGSMVRELARAEHKQVEYRAEGLHVQADRVVLQGLKDGVMHLLRNSVSHGIEPPSEREAAGKPPAGSVALRIRARGDRLELAVEDDGRGLDLRRIGAAAVEHGFLPAGAAASLTEADAVRLILRPGFTTAGRVTELAGRGIGLSAARQAARSLGGDLTVSAIRPFGTRIALSVPLSISSQRVLLLESAGHVFGLPAAAVDRLWRGPVSDVKAVDGRDTLALDGGAINLMRLSDVLGLTAAPGGPAEEETPRKLHVAVLMSGGERVGLLVDRFLDDREAVVKSAGLPPAIAGVSAGGIPLEDGGVAVMLNPPAVMERCRAASPVAAVPPPSVQKRKARILVVDDSLTTRSLEKSILEAYGYDVRVAVDGVQALEELRARGADLVITDVMMPRMDGLELLGQMKADRSLAQIPVIMVTSLERREDQERGLSLGADAYIVKRKFDQRELLSTVRQII